jgi:hypothetical protein
LRDIGVAERIILKWNFVIQGVRIWTWLSCFGVKPHGKTFIF